MRCLSSSTMRRPPFAIFLGVMMSFFFGSTALLMLSRPQEEDVFHLNVPEVSLNLSDITLLIHRRCATAFTSSLNWYEFFIVCFRMRVSVDPTLDPWSPCGHWRRDVVKLQQLATAFDGGTCAGTRYHLCTFHVQIPSAWLIRKGGGEYKRVG